MNSVLVLGGNGFLGQSIVKLFKQHDILRIATGDIETSGNSSDILIDVLDNRTFDVINEPFDVIINCTGQITSDLSLCYQLNTTGIQNIIDYSQHVHAKLVQISTIAVYGSGDYADESSPLQPETFYAACKGFAEQQLRASKTLKDSLLIVRLSNLYGLGQAKGIVAYLLRSYKSDRKLSFNNDGSMLRYYLGIDDAASVISSLIEERSAGIFNVLGDDHLTIHNLVEMVEAKKSITYDTHYDSFSPPENIASISRDKLSNTIPVDYKISLDKYIDKYFN